MCSQADDPSQHVSDDTLRAALDKTARRQHAAGFADSAHVRYAGVDEGEASYVLIPFEECPDVLCAEARGALAASATEERDEWGSDLDVAEWLVWYARKRRGKARDVARLALDENPSLRFTERIEARAALAASATEEPTDD